MSVDVWPETKYLPAITLFYGGKGRGKCIQLTKREEDGFVYYITIRTKDLPRLIDRLQRINTRIKVGGARLEKLERQLDKLSPKSSHLCDEVSWLKGAIFELRKMLGGGGGEG